MNEGRTCFIFCFTFPEIFLLMSTRYQKNVKEKEPFRFRETKDLTRSTRNIFSVEIIGENLDAAQGRTMDFWSTAKKKSRKANKAINRK